MSKSLKGLPLECLGPFREAAIMPTDLDAAVSARKRAEQAQTQTLVTIVLVWIIICLGMVGLLFEVVRQ